MPDIGEQINAKLNTHELQQSRDKMTSPLLKLQERKILTVSQEAKSTK